MSPATPAVGQESDFQAPGGVWTPSSWFDAPERRQRLQEEARSWAGTPFFPHGTRRGPCGGVSCQTLVSLIYIDCGFLPRGWAIPVGPIQTGYQAMVETIDRDLAPHFVALPSLAPGVVAGDLICYRLGRQGHLGIVLENGVFIHCLRHFGVDVSRLDDAAYLNLQRRVWRPVIPKTT